MTKPTLADVLLTPVSCADCPAAHAAGGPSKCHFETIAVSKGELIFVASDKADRVWFVRAGVVHLATNGSEATAATIIKGGVVGLDCLVSDDRLSSARAATDLELCAMSKSDLVAWLGADERRLSLILDAATADPTVARALDKISPRRG